MNGLVIVPNVYLLSYDDRIVGFYNEGFFGQLTPSENTADVRNISMNHGYAI